MKKGPFLFVSSIVMLLSLILGFVGGAAGYFTINELEDEGIIDDITGDQDTGEDERDRNTIRVTDEQSSIIEVAEEASNSVVSIVITAEVPVYEYFYNDNVSTEEQQIGAGTGFVVNEDGLIVTNRHVVDQEDATYTVVFNDGSTTEASVVARDSLLDIAFLEIDESDFDVQPLPLGDSDELKKGQTVIAIGNALGEFSNTVSSGIISGLQRRIVAGNQEGGNTEVLDNVIQTDASINFGNSGGPLLDIDGHVIGINVAVSAEGENIGFAIPINFVKNLVERLEREGNIERPILGVRYIQINELVQEERDLSVDYGALITVFDSSDPIVNGSPAEQAGLQEGDIILEVDGERLEGETTLQMLIQEKYFGDEVELLVLRDSEEIEIEVELFKME